MGRTGVGKAYDTRPLHISGEFLGHKSVDEGGGDHEGDETPGTLGGDGAQRKSRRVDEQGVRRCLGRGNEICSERRSQEKGIGWKDPCWSHHVDGEHADGMLFMSLLQDIKGVLQGGPQDEV